MKYLMWWFHLMPQFRANVMLWINFDLLKLHRYLAPKQALYFFVCKIGVAQRSTELLWGQIKYHNWNMAHRKSSQWGQKETNTFWMQLNQSIIKIPTGRTQMRSHLSGTSCCCISSSVSAGLLRWFMLVLPYQKCQPSHIPTCLPQLCIAWDPMVAISLDAQRNGPSMQ